jgi:RNA polymerase sigma-70 factor (ECF subfamily)
MASHMRPVPIPEAKDSRLTADEPMSFEEFFDSERSRLFGALSVMAGNRFEAEEIMQDAFLKLWERWDRVTAMENPVGFLYRTAMNLYRKHLRRAAIAMRKRAGLLPQDDALAAIEARDQATRLLRTLTAREREALVLTAYLGYSSEDAGRFLGIKANTVRVLATRARASLKQTVEDPT